MADRRIALTQSKVAVVDDADWDLVKEFTWSARRGNEGSKELWYAVGRGWVKNQDTGLYSRTGKVRMHRLILGVTDPTVDVDHRNGDGLDNRRENLRMSTRSQNNGNQRIRQGGSSRYKGVSAHTDGKWVAKISARGEQKYLGLFGTEEEAARTYDAAAQELFGEFARLNFPDEGETP